MQLSDHLSQGNEAYFSTFISKMTLNYFVKTIKTIKIVLIG